MDNFEEKVSLEDEARAMSDAALAKGVLWADDVSSERAERRRTALVLLSGYADSESSRQFTRDRARAIRAEAHRRQAGGSQCPLAVAKMQRVFAYVGLSAD